MAIAMFILKTAAIAQEIKPPANWQNMDQKADGFFGISMDRVYKEILKDKKVNPVTVAVIDGGTDITHEDLKNILWVNPKEIPGNKKDDDGNGYTDDVHGWNFLGSSKGNFHYDNKELVRQLRAARLKSPGAEERQMLEQEVSSRQKALRAGLEDLEARHKALKEITTAIGKPYPTITSSKRTATKANWNKRCWCRW